MKKFSFIEIFIHSFISIIILLGLVTGSKLYGLKIQDLADLKVLIGLTIGISIYSFFYAKLVNSCAKDYSKKKIYVFIYRVPIILYPISLLANYLI
jgi:hypothetical protein